MESTDLMIALEPAQKALISRWQYRQLQTQLAPRYRLGRLLGAGGFSTVLSGYDRVLRRRVAIKINRKTDQFDQPGLQNEARFLARLHHPCIQTLYEYQPAVRGLPAFLVLRPYAERSLADELQNGAMAIDRASRIVSRLAVLLEYCHRHGIVHADIKPANVLLLKNDRPVLIDFGLSFRHSGQDATELQDRRVGSPGYMAPECFLEPPTCWTSAIDMYALGILFFELLTGSPPYCGTIQEVMKRTIEGTIPLPTSIRCEIPDIVENCCMELLNLNYQERPASLRSYATKLGQAAFNWNS